MRRRKAVFQAISVLVATLLIGVIMGAAIMGNVIRHRVTEIQQFTNAEGFKSQMMAIVDPVDAAQAEAITPIVDAFGERFAARIAANRQEFFLSLGRLDAELDPHLTPEQRERLAAHRERLQGRINRYGDSKE